ncbi:MAG: phage replisome organizer N-terminal domain-containing protein [Emergencia sp.]|nr:phage replisome organizer N-terminal domain-containing protein [Emergencia sp.]
MKKDNRREGSAATKYWYFRFSKNFFNDIGIIKMESLIGGYEYLVILLKLYALSTEHGGVFSLPATPSGDLDVALLSEILRHKVQAVGSAIEYFTTHGFMELVSEPETEQTYLYFPEVKYNTGQSSKDADRKRIERQKKAEAATLPEPADEREKPGKVYGEFKNVSLTNEEYRKFSNRYENANVVIEKLSIWKAKRDKSASPKDYAYLLSFAETDGILKQSEKEKRTITYERYKREALLGYPPPQDIRDMITEMQWEELKELAEKNFDKS